MRVLVALASLGLVTASFAQTWPTTRAERTNYNETSHYSDVIDFLDGLKAMKAPIRVETIGTSTDGKAMPLVIASYPMVRTFAEARKSGKPIVYIQANIHAGEVEGKEAILHILRRVSQDPMHAILSNMVLLVTPIYNIDGNEKFGPVAVNRPEQNGPIEVGLRPNGQGFDLNRDAIKAESPETRAVLEHVYGAWNPDVMMDLHTTDGTRHGWELTYSPGLNPNTDPAIQRLTKDIIAEARQKIKAETGKLLFDYGNTETRGGNVGWYSFEPFGRYCTNYVGLRNRVAILSEATTYIPFKDRVTATDEFVMKVLERVARTPAEIIRASESADTLQKKQSMTAPQMGVRFTAASRGDEAVLLETKGSPHKIDERPTALTTQTMPIFDHFIPTKTAALPMAYAIDPTQTRLIDLLKRHGIQMIMSQAKDSLEQEVFSISKINQSAREFQGHKAIDLVGQFSKQKLSLPKGWMVVSTYQPLGTMAFQILEPEGQDGAAAWGFLDLKEGENYPIRKIYADQK